MQKLIDLLFIRRTSNIWLQLFRYGFVGGAAFVVDYVTLFLLASCLGINHLIAAAIAFLLGLCTNWLLSISWVFNGSDKSISGFITFSLIGLVGLVLNEGIIYLGTDILGIHYMLSKLISTVLVFFWNFFARRSLVFQR